MVGRKRGGDVMKELTNKLNDILTDPKKYKKYQQDLAKYAWEQAQVFGYGGTLGQFLSTLCLGHIFQQGSSIISIIRPEISLQKVESQDLRITWISKPDSNC